MANPPIPQGPTVYMDVEAMTRHNGLPAQVVRRIVDAMLLGDNTGQQPPILEQASDGVFEAPDGPASDFARGRIANLIGRMRYINGQTTHAGIEFSARDIAAAGLLQEPWEIAASARLVNRGEVAGQVIYTISQDIATGDFFPRVNALTGKSIADMQTLKPRGMTDSPDRSTGRS